VGGAFNNKKIWDRVDSEGQYGRWKLRVMGSRHIAYFGKLLLLGSKSMLFGACFSKQNKNVSIYEEQKMIYGDVEE